MVVLFIMLFAACTNSSVHTDNAQESATAPQTDSINSSISNIPNDSAGVMTTTSTNDDCKCYANGESFEPGGTACLGGWRAVCISRNGNCGWDYPEYDGRKQPCEN